MAFPLFFFEFSLFFSHLFFPCRSHCICLFSFSFHNKGMKLSRDSLVGRVLEVSLGDLKEKGEDDAFRKIKLKVEEVSGSQCLTNFYGMDLTTDKLRSLVRKWHTLIEAHADVKTTDGYFLRLFCIGLTKRRLNQTSKTAYAQTSQVRKIRKKMVDIMSREASNCDLQELVQKKFLPETIGREIDKATQVLSTHKKKTKTKIKNQTQQQTKTKSHSSKSICVALLHLCVIMPPTYSH